VVIVILVEKVEIIYTSMESSRTRVNSSKIGASKEAEAEGEKRGRREAQIELPSSHGVWVGKLVKEEGLGETTLERLLLGGLVLGETIRAYVVKSSNRRNHQNQTGFIKIVSLTNLPVLQ
jgi:hypothetical protein